MANKNDDKKTLRCSFCHKTQDQVRKLIAGPNVYICDECIDLCSEIIEEEFQDLVEEVELTNLPKPLEIKTIKVSATCTTVAQQLQPGADYSM